jgi:5-methylcytosine-specific restriction endonuclease McrA
MPCRRLWNRLVVASAAILVLAVVPPPSYGRRGSHSSASHYHHSYSGGGSHSSFTHSRGHSLSRLRSSTSRHYHWSTPSRTSHHAHVSNQVHHSSYAARHRSSSHHAYYKSSGLPEHRSADAKRRFLRQHGYRRVPPGYEVDHIVPLSAGGADTPSNMELISKSAHHRKTASESKRYHWHRRR